MPGNHVYQKKREQPDLSVSVQGAHMKVRGQPWLSSACLLDLA